MNNNIRNCRGGPCVLSKSLDYWLVQPIITGKTLLGLRAKNKIGFKDEVEFIV